ncbi:MAG TPA: oxalurate catabolism protein HpxZ [Steroidobacteraceae bacterium]|nr:oxalurate catabolism protein HpxZ [Steroidobacteraceae bacterium]
MIINDPTTLAEVTAAFERYEHALMSNDLTTLDELFWNSPQALRYGVGETLHGIAAIREFRRKRIGGSPSRALENTIITTFGTDLGTANTQFRRANSSQLGRQSQVWVRMGEGWRIVSAHVSLATGFP